MSLDDPAGREAFVDANYHALYAWLWWLTGSRDAAADLAQESFAAFWASLGRVRVRRPRVWLYHIARNRWRKWCGEAKRRDASDLGPDVTARDPGPDESAARTELIRRVVRAVDELPRAYRETLILRHWGDLPYREIAAVLGIPTALARWRVHRAGALVRERLGDSGDEPGGV